MTKVSPDTPSVRIGKTNKRIQCDWCFKTLDPKAKDPLNSEFIHCMTCGSNFHAIHVQSNCPKCKSNQLRQAHVLSPPPLKSNEILRAIEVISPSKTSNTLAIATFADYKAVVRYWARLILQEILAFVLTVIAALIGAYADRWVSVYLHLSQPNNLFGQLLNVTLRKESPEPLVLLFSAISAAITAYVFFPLALRNKEGDRAPMRRFIRLIGGIILLIALNIQYLGNQTIREQGIYTLSTILAYKEANREILQAQIYAALAVLPLAILYWIVTYKQPDSPKYPPPLASIRIFSSILRYILVSYILVQLALSIAAVQFGVQDSFVNLSLLQNFERPTENQATLLLMAFLAMAVALLVYQIPQHRISISAPALNLSLRVLASVVCLILAGIVYRSSTTVLPIEPALLSAWNVLVLVPAQRAYA